MKVLGYVSLLAVISGVLLGCKSTEPGSPPTVETVRARVVESREAQAPITVAATGTLHARQTAILSAQVLGRVERVLAREGDSVGAGQAIVILDDATLKSATDQAEAAVKAAENQQIAAQTNADLAASTLARYKQLQSQKSVSPQEMDEVARRAEAASAQVEASACASECDEGTAGRFPGDAWLHESHRTVCGSDYRAHGRPWCARVAGCPAGSDR